MAEGKLHLQKKWFIDSYAGNIKEVYHFIERLGSGGFGVVYLAKHRKTGKSIKNLILDLGDKFAIKAV